MIKLKFKGNWISIMLGVLLIILSFNWDYEFIRGLYIGLGSMLIAEQFIIKKYV